MPTSLSSARLGSAWGADVLEYWFEAVGPAAWFLKNDETDATIRDRFATIHADLMAASSMDLVNEPPEALAATIVLDQFSRNMFRGTAVAFAGDAHALDIARRSIDLGHDVAVPIDRRVFFYLPFEHSESPADQDRSVALISALGNPTWTHYADAHKAVIQRFGRFPHRNKALGRASTAAELAFLEQPGSSF